MQILNNFKVISIDRNTGQMELLWYDDTETVPGTLDVPIRQQNYQLSFHRIPPEAEENSWTRAQYLSWWVNEVQDVPDMPQWADDEVGTFVVEHRTRIRTTKLT